MKPVRKLLDGPYRTTVITDLFLDLWVTVDREQVILDADDFESALKRHEISSWLARRVRREIEKLARRLSTGGFPPIAVQRTRLSEVEGRP